VLLTGATGFLGSHVLQRLTDAGIPVTCAVRPGGAARLSRLLDGARSDVEVLEGSLQSDTDCPRFLAGCSIVIHVASATAGHPSQLVAGSVTPTRVLLQNAAACDIARFVHISSLGVYAPPERPGAELTEATPLDPASHLRDPYTFSKVLQERVVWEIAQREQLAVVVLRPGVIYGPGKGYLTPRVGLAAGSWLCVMGGRHRLPYTFVENCADAVVRAAFQPAIEGEVFNIVDDELPTGRELVKHARARGHGVRTLRRPASLVPAAAGAYEWLGKRTSGLLPKVLTTYRARAQWTPVKYSNLKARTRLGWTPTVPLREGLQRSAI
jgi:nucleoside-diphosphate-sugar epimerase